MLEIDVPVLGLTGASDVHIDCPRLAEPGLGYLQSSPEYFMKRLLAAGSGSIYCLGKAFRLGELGERHYPEFTMLEWYRVGWDEHRLMEEVFDLIAEVGALDHSRGYLKKTYRELFQSQTGIDPHTCGLAALRTLAGEVAQRDFGTEDRSTCLDLIFSLRIESALPTGVVFVYDYPACQAALAKTFVNSDGIHCARRFEVFLDGTELGNGYYELTDAVELRDRFAADNVQRRRIGKGEVEPDEHLLAAMSAGLPPCAGVAIGFDRLLMNLLGASNISAVLPFVDLVRD